MEVLRTIRSEPINEHIGLGAQFQIQEEQPQTFRLAMLSVGMKRSVGSVVRSADRNIGTVILRHWNCDSRTFRGAALAGQADHNRSLSPFLTALLELAFRSAHYKFSALQWVANFSEQEIGHSS
jgi:hypothetical protein